MKLKDEGRFPASLNDLVAVVGQMVIAGLGKPVEIATTLLPYAADTAAKSLRNLSRCVHVLVFCIVFQPCLMASGCGNGKCPPPSESASTYIPLRIITTVLPYAVAGYPYEQGLIMCMGGTPPYAWSVSMAGLPQWAALSSTSGDSVFLAGLPQDADIGESTLIANVRDSLGCVAQQTLKLVVTQDLPTDYWSYMDLPDLTNAERKQSYDKTEEEWQRYYDQSYQEAQQLSDKLKQYILAWDSGCADPKIPYDLLPPSINSAKTRNWTLMYEDQVNPAAQWYVFPTFAVTPDYKNLPQHSSDPHTTYLKLIFIAPFGSELLVEGDFPYCRFMDYQIIEPFDPEFPATGTMGAPEVPIVDVDIEPDPGSVNPFRTGVNRNSPNRHYHLAFRLEKGNAKDLNPEVMNAPHYRAPGNTRIGGPFGSSGAYGDGVMVPAILWLRYYAIDKGKDALGGVPLPRVYLRLDTGETFWLQSDFSLARKRQTTQWDVPSTPPIDPPAIVGPSLGWLKVFGLYLIRLEAIGYQKSVPWGPWPLALTKRNIREVDAGLFKRGPQFRTPGNCEASATTLNYVTYLSRPLVLGANHVYVITGKMPTTPKTRNGETFLLPAEARYWSIGRYVMLEEAGRISGICVGSLMDDEVVLKEDNKYIIVYSRPEDRPRNAVQTNGVTWQNFGPQASGSTVIRWLSVYPDHFLDSFSPHEPNIPWTTGAWSQATYDKGLVGNNEPGAMGPYHPVIHYMTKEDFEALGNDIDPDEIPSWKQ